MPSPDQLRDSDERKTRQAFIKQSYEELRDNPAIENLLAYLDQLHDAHMVAAKEELDNPHKSMAYLQNATACDTIRMYIRQMMS